MRKTGIGEEGKRQRLPRQPLLLHVAKSKKQLGKGDKKRVFFSSRKLGERKRNKVTQILAKNTAKATPPPRRMPQAVREMKKPQKRMLK